MKNNKIRESCRISRRLLEEVNQGAAKVVWFVREEQGGEVMKEFTGLKQREHD